MINTKKQHTQLRRVTTNSRHAFVFLYQEHSPTLDMSKDHCTVAGLCMIFYTITHRDAKHNLCFRSLKHAAIYSEKKSKNLNTSTVIIDISFSTNLP